MSTIKYIAAARVPDRCRFAEFTLLESRETPRAVFDEKLDKVLVSSHLKNNTRLTITDDIGHIHYEADPAFIYLVVTAADYPQRTAFRLLADVRAQFDKSYSRQISRAKTSALSKTARPLFAELADKYQDPASFDKIANVEHQVDQVKGMMRDNIEAALKNTENLETLLDISDNMKNEASSFNRSTQDVKKRMQWKNLRMKILILVLVLLIAGVVAGSFIIRRRHKQEA